MHRLPRPGSLLLAPALALLAACGGSGSETPPAPAASTVAATLTQAAATTTAVEAEPALEGARVLATTCATVSIPYPIATVAAAGGSLWVACRDDATLERFEPDGTAAGSVSLDGLRPWALAGDARSVWAIDREAARVVRVDARSGEVVAQADLPGEPVAITLAGGAPWVLLDDRSSAVRLDAQGAVKREVAVGDGPSDALGSDGVVYVASHRADEVAAIGAAAEARTVAAAFGGPDDAPERLALAGGTLWVTGRGLDLVPVDPTGGDLGAPVEIGAAGLDLAADGDRLWAVTATPEAAQRGDPVVEAVIEVDGSTGAVAGRHAATGGLMLTGLAATGGGVVVADGLHGLLLRLD